MYICIYIYIYQYSSLRGNFQEVKEKEKANKT